MRHAFTDGIGLTCQGVSRVRDSRAGPQGGGDHASLDHLCVGCARLARVPAVNIDAIRALSREGHGDGNQLFVFYRDGSIGDGRLVEGPKGLHDRRREAVHFSQLCEIFVVIHKFSFF